MSGGTWSCARSGLTALFQIEKNVPGVSHRCNEENDETVGVSRLG